MTTSTIEFDEFEARVSWRVLQVAGEDDATIEFEVLAVIEYCENGAVTHRFDCKKFENDQAMLIEAHLWELHAKQEQGQLEAMRSQATIIDYDYNYAGPRNYWPMGGK